jgi:hypothetical protein
MLKGGGVGGDKESVVDVLDELAKESKNFGNTDFFIFTTMRGEIEVS